MAIFPTGVRFGSNLARAAVPQHVRIPAIARKKAKENAREGKSTTIPAAIAVEREKVAEKFTADKQKKK